LATSTRTASRSTGRLIS